MKRGLLVVGAIVALVLAGQGVRRLVSSSIDYRGQTIKLTKAYLDHDDYKNDPDNIDPSEIARVQELVSSAAIPTSFGSWEEATRAVFQIKFPGYGSGSLASGAPTLRAFSFEIPRGDRERVIVLRGEGGRWKVVDDFVTPAGKPAILRVAEENGSLVFSDGKGERLLVRPSPPTPLPQGRGENGTPSP